MHFSSEVVQQSELARFIRSLKDANVQTESPSEAIGVVGVELAFVVEETDAAGTFTGFDDKLYGSRLQPAPSLAR